jgi:glycosyltransferase involved in cell wall biosynthesis
MAQHEVDDDNSVRPNEVAILLQGDEVYGIGTIVKLYAIGLPQLLFIALGPGTLVDWLRANGNRVYVVPGLARFNEGGASIVTVIKMPWVFFRAWRDAVRIHAVLRSGNVRIIHSNWRPQQIISGMMRRYGYLSLWQINYTMQPRRLFGLGKWLNHRLAKWGADLLLPASDAIGDNWTGCGVPSFTIRNAATAMFSSPNELPTRPVRCLVAGRLENSKGHHLALEAVLRARQAGFDIQLDVFGGPVEDNPYADELRRTIAQHGCQNAIRLMGFDPNLRARHQDYHLGLQCRIDPEPCSLWVCEALVDGLPLLASATGGTPELVADGETGLLYDPNDVDDLSAKLRQLVESPDLLAQMRRNAFERGQGYFTLERFIRETLDAYKCALKSKNRGIK